jgi:PKD repeat protein
VLRAHRAVVVLSLALAACGGGGGGGGDGNERPTASFTATPTSGQAPLAVSFDASASSDPDGTVASYVWNFGDGSAGTGATASRTYATAGTYTVALTVTDNRGATAVTTRIVSVSAGPPPPFVRVTGRIGFERVPFSAVKQDGLDYLATVEAPAREVEVELLRASDRAVLATAVTDRDGNYEFVTPPSTSVLVRAKALSRPSVTPTPLATWNLRVLNNTNSNALYVLDGAVFDTGVTDQVRNLTAETGWGGAFAGYTGPRAAAPFAILDTLYEAVQFVIREGDPSAQLTPLAAYWSTSNRPSDNWDPATGDIEITQYLSSGNAGIEPGIYVLGAANNDSDEFDQHVIAHEFHHYLEDAVSRADSVGGDHSPGDRLDMRVAFSEGFANAFAGMVLDDPVYRDSYGTAQGSDFQFDVERDSSSVPGWYNEASVHRIAFDLFDATDDGTDQVSLGFAPIYDVLRNELRNGVPQVSLFSFVTALKRRPGVPAALVDARVAAEGLAGTSLGIDAVGMNAYATTETHSSVAPASADLVLPVYTPIAVNGPAVNLCTSSELTLPDGTSLDVSFNQLGNRRFLRFSLPGDRTIRIRVSCPSGDLTCSGLPRPDPDFVLSRAAERVVADEDTSTVEERVHAATAGDYVLEVYEYSQISPTATSRRGRTCLTVTITG